jgi:hypothetical protein
VAQQSAFCVRTVFGMLLLDVLIYTALTWYCDKVGRRAGAPWPLGRRPQALPPWLPCRQRWLRCRARARVRLVAGPLPPAGGAQLGRAQQAGPSRSPGRARRRRR